MCTKKCLAAGGHAVTCAGKSTLLDAFEELSLVDPSQRGASGTPGEEQRNVSKMPFALPELKRNFMSDQKRSGVQPASWQSIQRPLTYVKIAISVGELLVTKLVNLSSNMQPFAAAASNNCGAASSWVNMLCRLAMLHNSSGDPEIRSRFKCRGMLLRSHASFLQ